MKKAVVLGSGFVVLGAIRALAAESVKVVHLSTGTRDFAGFSKFIYKSIKAPSPKHHSSKLLDLLMNAEEKWDGALLLPTDDTSVVFISQNREALINRYKPAPQPWRIIGKIIDKKSLYLEAQKINIPTPLVFFPKTNEDLFHRQNDFSYPCILKPYQTPGFHSIFKKKVLLINSFEELTKRFAEVCKYDLDVMVSEIIPGADTQLSHYRSYIDDQGEILAEMCTQKLRQHPPEFGMACASKTIPINNEIRSLALKLLKNFSYQGESSVEFKLDKRDNQYKLMEINVRPVLPESHFVAAGINFPYITYMDLVENKKIKMLNYQKEIYWMNNFTDTREFIRNLRTRKLNFKEFFGPYWQKKVFCVPFFEDPFLFLMTSMKIWDQLKSILQYFLNLLSKNIFKKGKRDANRS